jgi:hypothetical protein
MTLIATMEIDGFPVLIGDLMLSMENSNQEESKSHFKLPTMLDVDSLQNYRVISGLAQKLALINDRIAIGWAGDYISAKMVIKEIYEAEKSSNLTFVDFKEILAGFVGSGIREVNLACLVVSGKHGKVKSRGFHCERFLCIKIRASPCEPSSA